MRWRTQNILKKEQVSHMQLDEFISEMPEIKGHNLIELAKILLLRKVFWKNSSTPPNHEQKHSGEQARSRRGLELIKNSKSHQPVFTQAVTRTVSKAHHSSHGYPWHQWRPWDSNAPPTCQSMTLRQPRGEISPVRYRAT